MKEITQKVLKSFSISGKFYFLVHLIPFLLNVRKNQRQGKVTKAAMKTVKNFIKSMLFMATLIGSLKTMKCGVTNLFNPMGWKIDGRIFIWGSTLSSFGIFLEDKYRREEITYFAFVRAVRSAYLLLKRNLPSQKVGSIKLSNELRVCFVMIFGLMSFFYMENPSTIKYINILEKIWGKI